MFFVIIVDMNKSMLDNYSLSGSEVLQSLFVGEYGLRHLALSKAPCTRWGHRIIAVIELCPLVGLIAMLIEAIVFKCFISGGGLPLPSPGIQSRDAFSSQVNLETNPISLDKILFIGNQSGCNGNVSTSDVQSIVDRLNQNSLKDIRFNQDKVTNTVTGGTCTAMALEFLHSYFQIKEECRRETSETLLERITQIGGNFASSSLEMRTRQAAFNTIEIMRSDGARDYSREKMQSLVNYHSLVIDRASKELDVHAMSEDVVQETVEALPDGAFLVRILKPADNEKLEECGHSMVYIKEGELQLFYDPNYGAINLSLLNRSKNLFNKFKECLQQFQLNQARFYRLQPTG